MKGKSDRFVKLTRRSAPILFLILLSITAGCNLSAPTEPVTPTSLPIVSPTLTQVIPTEPNTPAAAQESATPVPVVIPTEVMLTPVKRADKLPEPSKAAWNVVVQGLTRPVDMAAAMDGTGRLFVVEQIGRIVILQNGQLQPEPFLDIQDRITSAGNEQGLLGMALHPDFNNNGYFYLNYTDINGNTVIARYQRSADPNKANKDSEKILLRVDQPYENHNGGSVRFGPDGFLYLGLGDGGAQGDPHGNAQNPNSLLGKILRIDVNQGEPYGIPPGNLFQPGEGKPEIFAMGLRNPWRFSFDPANGDLIIADVGQDKWEEIDILPANSSGASNFGWNYLEGTHPYKGQPPEGLSLTMPVWEYNHSQGCSVTGGVVYHGEKLPEWNGIYLFADYCSGIIWGMLRNQGGSQVSQLYVTGISISSFGEDQNGEVYMLDLSGSIYRLEAVN
jgi:glucose/arabinose dehydrogenase